MCTAVGSLGATFDVQRDRLMQFQFLQSAKFEKRFPIIPVSGKAILLCVCSCLSMPFSGLVRLMTGKAGKQNPPLWKTMFLGIGNDVRAAIGTEHGEKVLRASLVVRVHAKKSEYRNLSSSISCDRGVVPLLNGVQYFNLVLEKNKKFLSFLFRNTMLLTSFGKIIFLHTYKSDVTSGKAYKPLESWQVLVTALQALPDPYN